MDPCGLGKEDTYNDSGGGLGNEDTCNDSSGSMWFRKKYTSTDSHGSMWFRKGTHMQGLWWIHVV
jgi:hypothetical protein